MTGPFLLSISALGRPCVKRFAVCYRTVVLSCLSVCLSVCLSMSCPVHSCPVCLCVTLVHCGQTVGRIKMKLGVQVGLGPAHNVLDGDRPPPQKGLSPPKIFGRHLLRPNSCMDQDAT